MGEHTPGPWVYDGSFVKSADGKALWHSGMPRDEREANAHLIAAAPDLLEACVNVLAYIKWDPLLGESMYSRMLETAIAKATGTPTVKG